jgi:hypothetical protein
MNTTASPTTIDTTKLLLHRLIAFHLSRIYVFQILNFYTIP